MGITNVISLNTLEKKYQVPYNSTQYGGAFVVNNPGEEVFIKRYPKTSFPYINLIDESSGSAVILVQTVRQRFEGWSDELSPREIVLGWQLSTKLHCMAASAWHTTSHQILPPTTNLVEENAYVWDQLETVREPANF